MWTQRSQAKELGGGVAATVPGVSRVNSEEPGSAMEEGERTDLETATGPWKRELSISMATPQPLKNRVSQELLYGNAYDIIEIFRRVTKMVSSA